jgi:two-component system chemotaxis response regulator CheB
MIRVLVVDDSAVVRALIRDALESDPDIRVVAEAVNGVEAIEQAKAVSPDLITMDVTMPVLDGLDATAEIMAKHPTPILVFTASLDRTETEMSFQAVQRGALDVMVKPAIDSKAGFESIQRELVDRVRMLSRIKVISHLRAPQRKTRRLAQARLPERQRVVVMGASLGGPNTVLHVLQALPPNFPAPILLVQHIAPGFTDGLAAWLSRESPIPVAVAKQGDTVRPGRVLLAPGDVHMAVRGGIVDITNGEPINNCRPAIDVLFSTAADYYKERVISVVLTGMGNDGAAGSQHVKRCRGTTIAQNQETCVVYGMPRAAVELGVVDHTLPITDIPKHLTRLAAPTKREHGSP